MRIQTEETRTENGVGWYGKINGRRHFFEGVDQVTPTSKSEAIATNWRGRKFEIFGGRCGGGAANEWFVQVLNDDGQATDEPAFRCKSVIDSLDLLSQF